MFATEASKQFARNKLKQCRDSWTIFPANHQVGYQYFVRKNQRLIIAVAQFDI